MINQMMIKHLVKIIIRITEDIEYKFQDGDFVAHIRQLEDMVDKLEELEKCWKDDE